MSRAVIPVGFKGTAVRSVPAGHNEDYSRSHRQSKPRHRILVVRRDKVNLRGTFVAAALSSPPHLFPLLLLLLLLLLPLLLLVVVLRRSVPPALSARDTSVSLSRRLISPAIACRLCIIMCKLEIPRAETVKARAA